MSNQKCPSIFKRICIVAFMGLIGVMSPINSSIVVAQRYSSPVTQDDPISITKDLLNVPKKENGIADKKAVQGIENTLSADWPSIVNGNFEQGQYVGWGEYSTHGWDLVLPNGYMPVSPHTGSWATWLGGEDNDTSYIYQNNINLSTSASATLQLWYWIASQDVCGRDYGYIQINTTTVYTWNLCSSKNTGRWVKLKLNLNAYVGQTVNLTIKAVTDMYLNSNLFIDDVTLISSWVGGVNVSSDKNVVAVGRPHVGAEVASYDGFSSGNLNSYVPMLFKDAFGGSYDSALYIQNTHETNSANITIKYYDNTGSLNCTKADTIAPLASKGYWLPSTNCDSGSLPAGWVGGVVVTSDQPVVAVGRPHIGGEVMTYNGFTGGSTTSYIPMLFKGAFGGSYNSAFYIQNTHDTNSANVTIKYYDNTGSLNCTKSDTITSLSSKGYWLPSAICDSGSLPAGWVGGVVVTSDQPIVAVGRPHIGAQVTTYTGFTGGNLSSYVPMLFKGAFGGSYDSAFYIQNTHDTNSANVIIKYYDNTGVLNCTKSDTIAPLASKGYWLPSATCDSGSLPAGWVGGVVVTSDQPVVAVGRPHIGAQVTTYNGFTGGSPKASLPMLFKDAFGGSYDLAVYVQNTEATSASVTLEFYDTNGTLSCSVTDTIPALSTLGYWIPSITCDP